MRARWHRVVWTDACVSERVTRKRVYSWVCVRTCLTYVCVYGPRALECSSPHHRGLIEKVRRRRVSVVVRSCVRCRCSGRTYECVNEGAQHSSHKTRYWTCWRRIGFLHFFTSLFKTFFTNHDILVFSSLIPSLVLLFPCLPLRCIFRRFPPSCVRCFFHGTEYFHSFLAARFFS